MLSLKVNSVLLVIVNGRVSQPGVLEPQGVRKKLQGVRKKIPGYENYSIGVCQI